MKTLKWILLTGCLVATLAGCDHTKEYRDFLTETDKRVIPYKKGETVRFTDEAGVVCTMTVCEDRVVWKEDWEYGTLSKWECREVCLQSERVGLQIDLEVESWCYEESNVRVQTSSGGDLRVGYDLLGLLDTHDSLEINRHTYYNVAVVDDRREKGSQLYYNTDYGILQVKEGDRAVFTLIP